MDRIAGIRVYDSKMGEEFTSEYHAVLADLRAKIVRATCGRTLVIPEHERSEVTTLVRDVRWHIYQSVRRSLYA